MIEPIAGERQPSETDKAVQACNDYLRMGAGRSLSLLAQKYTENDQKRPPTKAEGTLKDWSTTYGWVERASLYDAELERLRTEAAQRAMQEGLALDWERVGKLKRLAEFLEDQIYEVGANGVHHNVWLPDVKQVGMDRVEIERFNGAILDQYRGVLDDLAKETGGRKKIAEMTGKDGKELIVKVIRG